MKKIILATSHHQLSVYFKTVMCLAFLYASLIAAGQKEISLYKSPAPGSEDWNWQEKEFFVKVPLNAKVIYNITKPTLTVFTPDSSNGCAVIVCPGGGGRVLNFESEGIRVANQLVKKGVTVFILKYRLAQSFTEDPWQEMMNAIRKPDSSSVKKTSLITEMARTDLNIAIRYVKEHASEFKIDTTRIGLMGFSAGGQMVARVAYHFTPQTKPAFVAPIYCVITRINDRTVKPDAPPLFIAAATDDQLADISNSLNLYNDWMNAKRPVELHIYSKGGHGLRGLPAESWICRFEEWLNAEGFLKQKN